MAYASCIWSLLRAVARGQAVYIIEIGRFDTSPTTQSFDKSFVLKLLFIDDLSNYSYSGATFRQEAAT